MMGKKILRLIVKTYLLPLKVGRRIINKGYFVLNKFYKIPQKKDLDYEDWIYELTTKKLGKENSEIKETVSKISDEMITNQWGYKPEFVLINQKKELIPLKGSISQYKYYFSHLVCFIKNLLNEKEIIEAKFLDVGASSSLFFNLMGKSGIGLNCDKSAVKNIKKAGIEAVFGDAEKIPFKDKSIDYIFFFNTLNHVENPILTMKEIKRVCKKMIFVSMGEAHQFDFLDFRSKELDIAHWCKFRWTRESFLKLIEYLNLKLIKEEYISYSEEPQGLQEILFQRIWGKGSAYRVYAIKVC
jgi:SAM-dependent methyltransferase